MPGDAHAHARPDTPAGPPTEPAETKLPSEGGFVAPTDPPEDDK
jgi:hypothetical protein